MPNDTKAKHPSGLTITFQEEGHLYFDENNVDYTSATTLVHGAFEKFDAEKISAAKSARTGIPAATYLTEWKEKADRASESGTRAHENCERQILGRFSEMHTPRDEKERLRFRAAWNEVQSIQAAFSELRPEMLIFSPRFCVAGSVDLLAKKATGEYTIIDWKYIQGLKFEGYHGKMGTVPATEHLPDCNYYHYALQLNIYEMILKLEGYIPRRAIVKKMLNVYREDVAAFDHYPLPDLHEEALLLLAFNVTKEGTDYVPF